MTSDVDLDDLDDEGTLAQEAEALVHGELTVAQFHALAVRHAAPQKSNVQVASVIGVHRNTLNYWLQAPSFRQLWDDQAKRHQAIVHHLRNEGEITSFQTLISVQKDSDTVASTRVDAAARLLTAVQRAREHETVSAGQWLQSGKWAEMFEESKEMLKEAVDGEVMSDAGRVVSGDDAGNEGDDGRKV